ncbi:MAG TPA: hypothetical protein VFT39_20370 [Vicinamibacterales bacterium]|nr:hypothetical protein [Vicinamibacterales bacterium]
MAGRCRLIVMAMGVSLSLMSCACSRSSSPPVDQAKAAVPGTGTSTPPAQPVNEDAKALAAFLDRVNQYVLVHQKLENTLPKLSKESTPQQVDAHQRALSKLIQDARKDAKQAEIFTPESQVVIKKLIAKIFSGPDGAGLKASVMDENPGVPNLKVNDRYPDEIPVSTIPPQLLEGLPKLPEEMEYRFVGDDLILMDTHAHIIADFIPNTFTK